MFGVERWRFMACALFMLCPRRFCTSALLSNNLPYSNQELISKSGHARGILIMPIRPKKPLSIIKGNGSTSISGEAEPGFNFDEEEMKKLKIWPGGIVPYYIDQFSFDKVLRDRLRDFLDLINHVTGLNFLELHRPPDDSKTRWVFFINRQGLLSCVDHPFRNFTIEGVQKIMLGYDCLSNGGELADVILSLIGVPPQHNAPNRDKYIQIEKNNIMREKVYLFEILKDNEWLFHDIDYDFSSAGHYPLHKYTANGKATIKPLVNFKKNNQGIAIGEGKGFSHIDIWKIKMIYNYISKKRLKSVNIPDCNKLFDLGAKINNSVIDSENDVKPRKKPNKYLGLPDETKTPPHESQEISNKTNNKPAPKDEANDDKENTEIESLEKSKESENENEKSDDLPKEKPKKNTETNSEEDREKLDDKNPLVDLSDFNTDDNESNEEQQKLKFIRPGSGIMK